MTYMTKAGDMVDAIAFKQYGATDTYTEALLNANPGLADRGPVLPAGVIITLPTIAPQLPQVQIIQLWD